MLKGQPPTFRNGKCSRCGVNERRKGGRYCLECNRSYTQAYRAAQTPENTAKITCSSAPAILIQQATPLDCRAKHEVVPYQPYWWGKNKDVGVYIDTNSWPHPSTAWSDICQGISSWSVATGNSYACFATNGPSPNTTAVPYEYVTKCTTSQCGRTNIRGTAPSYNCPYKGNDTLDCVVGGTDTRGPKTPGLEVQVAITWLDQSSQVSPTSLYIGLAAHEEGHHLRLDNCDPYNAATTVGCTDNTPQAPSSLMGSQATLSSAQPRSPTECDQYWYNDWTGIITGR